MSNAISNVDLRQVDLRHLAAADLEPLLRDETDEWQTELDWDFEANAGVVRRCAEVRALSGWALMDGGDVAAYGYTVVQENKGLIGDLYVRPPWRGSGAEAQLFRALLDQTMNVHQVRRVETQLMLASPETAKLVQRERFVRLYERQLMSLDTTDALAHGKAAGQHRFSIEPWSERHENAAAAMLVLAYDGHVDAQINEQYRTRGGAAEFLTNLLQNSGCGIFHAGTSFAAIDLVTGWLAGMVLCGFVAEQTAHVAQVCVSPRARGAGLGYELLRLATEAARAAGARRVSLTVTTANKTAFELYAGCGFRERRSFYAYVWERP